jgi:lipid-A-disaccharide synthase
MATMLAAKLDLLRESGAGLGSLLLAVPRHAMSLGHRDAALREYAILERDEVPEEPLDGAAPPPCALKNIVLACGDVSGEAHALRLLRELRARHPQLRVRGFGGARLAAEGMEVWEPLADLNVMGIKDVAARLPLFLRAVHRFAAEIRREPPDAVVLVDYPGLNRVLLRIAARRGIPVLDYIAPQLWAWAPWRIKDFRRAQKLLTILPFERDWYRRHGAQAEFIGHPLGDALAEAGADEAPEPPEMNEPGGPWIGILPGSRRRELRDNLPQLLEAAALLRAKMPEVRFVLPHLRMELWPALRAQLASSAVPVVEAPGCFQRILPRLSGAWAVSGTASVEVALCGVPTVVVYHIKSRFGAWYARRALTIPHVGALNLMAGRELLPEVVGLECPPELLAGHMVRLLESAAQADLRHSLRRIRTRCAPPGAAARAARAIERGVAESRRTLAAAAR